MAHNNQRLMRKSQHFVLLLAAVAFLLVIFLRREGSVLYDDGANGNASRETRQVLPIRQIAILGERNSGTRWTYE